MGSVDRAEQDIWLQTLLLVWCPSKLCSSRGCSLAGLLFIFSFVCLSLCSISLKAPRSRNTWNRLLKHGQMQRGPRQNWQEDSVKETLTLPVVILKLSLISIFLPNLLAQKMRS